MFLNPFPVTHPIHDDRERIKEPVAAGKSQRNERTVWTMKFNAVLMTLDQNTKIRFSCDNVWYEIFIRALPGILS